MTIDEVKRNLKYTYEKHRNDNIATFDTNISHMAMDCYNAIEQLEKEKKEAYNKAIDDFVNACKEDISCQTFGLHIKEIERISERLKAGGNS